MSDGSDNLDPITRALHVLRTDAERTDAESGFEVGDRMRDAYRAALERDAVNGQRRTIDGRDGGRDPSRRDGPRH